jgi:tetraprenyl-beta-curcumene synthase
MLLGATGDAGRQAFAFARAVSVYWLDIFPVARRELRRWKRQAESIPNPELRRDALFTHRTKSRHSEGLAAFAGLAPSAHRHAVIRGAVAFELILDYLDTVSEHRTEDPLSNLSNCLQLHRAFNVAVDLEAQPEDYYALHPHRDDGGYLAAQIDTCREILQSLPSYSVVAEPLRRCAKLSGQAQSLNHAIPLGLDEGTIATWARETTAEIQLDREVKWWEIVAAGSSSLPIGALMAAASDPTTSIKDAARIEVAYFPWVAALSSLLDCLIDIGDDQVFANHLNRYTSEEDAAEHLASIASRSLELVSVLPQAESHRMIVGSVGGYYLAQPNAWLPGRDRIARRVLEALGVYARPALVVHCIRQGRPRVALRAVNR